MPPGANPCAIECRPSGWVGLPPVNGAKDRCGDREGTMSPSLSGSALMSDPSLGPSVPLAPPLYTSSVYNLPDLDTLDRVMNGEQAGFIYARDGPPNAKHLADNWAARGGPRGAVAPGPGRGARAPASPGYVPGGARIFPRNRLYGRTIKL